MTPSRPSVTVIMAVLNEADHIDRVLAELLGQDYAGEFEVVVADGGSSDGTIQKLQAVRDRDDRLTVIDNPNVRQAYGLNLAAAHAKGAVLVRADGHTSFSRDYLTKSVDAFLENGGAVGGRMNPVGQSRFGRAVAAVMNSPLTMGPARFHHAEHREQVDTVYLGTFWRSDFFAVGGFRSFPSGSSEDADFYYRWRKSGRSVYVDPGIKTSYTPRGSPRALWRQYFRYGAGKAEMWWVNGRLPSTRPLAPAILVLAILVALLLGVTIAQWWALLIVVLAWLALLGWVAVRSGESVARVTLVAAIMHMSYGLGFLIAIFSGAVTTRELRIDQTRGPDR